MSVKSFAAITALLLSAMSPSSQATVLNNTTGLTGIFTTETFTGNVGNQSFAGNQFAGINFSAGMRVTDDDNGVGAITGSGISNFFPCCEAQSTISFSSALTDIAFGFISNPGTSTFEAYLGTMLVETATVGTSTNSQFVGFTGSLFDSIHINAGGGNQAFVLDNLQSRSAGAVPEPASVALLGMALAGIVVSRLRRQSATQSRGTSPQ